MTPLTINHRQLARRSVNTARRLTVLYVLMGQALAGNPGEKIYPQLQILNNRQQEALQREQQSDKSSRYTPSAGREDQRYKQEIKRQNIQLRQLQQQHRSKAVTGQQRALSVPDGPARTRTEDDLGRFRREQEAQRLRLKIQRRSWQVR